MDRMRLRARMEGLLRGVLWRFDEGVASLYTFLDVY